MGFSGEMHFMIPFGFLVVLFKYVIVDFQKYNLFKYFILGSVLYTGIKIYLLKNFYYNKDFIAMSIILFVIHLVFSYFNIYRKIRMLKEDTELDYDLLRTYPQTGYIMGTLLFSYPFVIRILNLSYLYRGEIKNFYLLLIEYLISSVIIIFTSRLGSKNIKKNIER